MYCREFDARRHDLHENATDDSIASASVANSSNLVDILHRLTLDRMLENDTSSSGDSRSASTVLTTYSELSENLDHGLTNVSKTERTQKWNRTTDSDSKETAPAPTNQEQTKKKRPSLNGLLQRLSSGRRSQFSFPVEEEPEASRLSGRSVELVHNLPQTFIAKQLGHRPTWGLWGTNHTRAQVDDLVEAIQNQECDCTLVNLIVTDSGLDVHPHKKNTGPDIRNQHFPIEYISYVVQDHRFTRIFCFIQVREMSFRSKKLECHAFLCDSSQTAHLLSLTFAVAFNEYQKKLKGKPFQFHINLSLKEQKDEGHCQSRDTKTDKQEIDV